MTDNQVAGLCRLTVRAPAKNIDLAVPSDVPVADLLPAILGYAGDDLEETGIEHAGWVLQRLGAPPLDEERTLDSLGLRDGETLYLRPRTEALPEVHLDDLVDGIATTMRQRPYNWSPEASRRLLRGLAVAALVTGLLVLALPGGSATPRALCAAVAGLLLLAGAAAASRAVGDAGAAASLGCMVSPYLALAGWLLTGGELSGPHEEVLGPRLLAASAAGAGGAVLALAAVASFAALFLCLAVVAAFGALTGVLVTTADLAPGQAAALAALLAVVLGAFVPSLSFRMSGLRMPPLPTNAQQLQEGIEPHPTAAVASRAVLADGWMTSLYGAVGVVCAASLTLLVRHGGLPATITAVALCLLLLLHSRGLGQAWQRLSLIVPAAWGVLLLVHDAAHEAAPDTRLLVVSGLLAGTAVIAIASWTVPGRRIVPYWARGAELLHSTMAISLLPLTLWVLGVYGALRSLRG
ncbi:type VII secretion integral membrane protein EccD [Streptomyces zagrosensis]|uniref:Type VII secretion integral membrane protein EccD n=1 Tax=Streptomyces zagrosensis TaxID=1042984 RepID=A0A7W9V2W5_9ACTN|nr:type VII secretion integral membrane protein EccD [Streptomyces zagrosensis]MBB5939706.1 type VII secretion integral membrane protein EccD [Streptomyces zagrosensis]